MARLGAAEGAGSSPEKPTVRGYRHPDLVALLPGSREREVEALFPPMLDAARLMRENNPSLRFATTAASRKLADRLKEMAEEAGFEDFEVGVENVHAVILADRAAASNVASEQRDASPPSHPIA